MGRASGECYVELVDKVAAEEAKRFDKQEMNNRYIEGDQDTPYNFVVRLRGIPFSATNNDVKEFFSGLEVADVVIDKELGGRPSGEAFVRFASKQHAEMALERNRNNMGSRYGKINIR
uniref:Bm10720 n=1 Tax=Brugia malayi TaxID=6279 RepID=A0A0H5SA07_BRUMA|nr:Bm10720 [Brugia malayi]